MKCLTITCALIAGMAHAQNDADYSRTDVGGDKATAQWVSVHSKEAWAGGVFKFYYNPQNQPANLSMAEVVNALQTAAGRWAGMCNITMQYMGTTTMEPRNPTNQSDPNGLNVIGFKALTGAEGAFTAYTPWLVQYGKMLHADILINTNMTWSVDDLTAVMTHEMGHAIGLEHSDASESVMYAKPYHAYSYLNTLRGDDASGCTALYGASENQVSNRIMNWAESIYPNLLGNATMPTGFTEGYLYRYYAATNSYIGSRDGRAYYYVPATGSIQDVGALSDYLPMAAAAGY